MTLSGPSDRATTAEIQERIDIMANTQGGTSSRQGSARGTARGKGSTDGRRSTAANLATVETDDTYGVVSVLYHALQGAETISQYIEDARAAENDELVAFFEDCKAKQNEIAMEGKRLLAEQLIDLEEDSEEEAGITDEDE